MATSHSFLYNNMDVDDVGDTMKLSEYIIKKYDASQSALSSKDINEWIIEWYKTEFNRAPPMWLMQGKIL